MVRIVIAPDKFKGSLTADQVATAVEKGIRQISPGVDIIRRPVADGGDGTVAAFSAAGYASHPVTVTGPLGNAVAASFARLGSTAVVELADASGLSRLPAGHKDPLHATSRGTGEVIAAAIRAGCNRIILGLGGSACTDGGVGLVQALGARVTDQNDHEIPYGGAALASAIDLDLTELRNKLAKVAIEVASDVDNQLLGPQGAAAVYSPQKGANHHEVETLENALTIWADLVAKSTGTDHRNTPGAGAAGGVGFAALSLLGATMNLGIELILDLLEFDELRTADLVIVGEGSLDDQTLNGKAPVGVARRARRFDIPVVAVCGRNTLSDTQLAEAGIRDVYSLNDLEPDLETSMSKAAALLTRLGAEIARDISRWLPDPAPADRLRHPDPASPST